MLELTFEGEIKLFEKREKFIDYENKSLGKIPFYLYYIEPRDIEGEAQPIEQFKSEIDFSALVGKLSVLTVGYWNIEGKSGLKLLRAVSAKD